MSLRKDLPGNYQYWALHEASPIRRRWHCNKFRLIELVMPCASTDLVVDAGCGSGNLSAFLADSCQRCLGIDIEAKAIRFASEMYSDKENLRFIESSLIDAPIEHNTVDKIYCIEVIEHLNLADANSAIAAFGSWLKPGGKLLITTPNYKSFWPFLEWFSDAFALSPQMADEQHVTRFSAGNLREVLTENGFLVDKIGSFNLMSPFIAPFSKRLSSRMADWEITAKPTFGSLLYARCIRR